MPRRRLIRAASSIGLLTCLGVSAQAQTVSTTELSPGAFLVQTPRGNAIVKIGTKESVIVGVMAPEVVATTKAFLARRKAPAARYVIIGDTRAAASYGTGGWDGGAAITIAHEGLRGRILETLREAGPAADETALPALGFSGVVQLAAAGGEIHAVHERNGASDGAFIVHFEGEHVVYLGEDFTPDAYPDIRADAGGSILGMIGTLNFFVTNFRGDTLAQYVPARGPATRYTALREYGFMLVNVRNRVKAAIDSGRTESEVVASQPTRDLDARWGHGSVKGSDFVANVYRSLKRP